LSTTNDQDPVCIGHCPQCGPHRKADVVASHVERFLSKEDPVSTMDTYNILKCRGCEHIYMQREFVLFDNSKNGHCPITGEMLSVVSRDTTYWPAPVRRKRPNWLKQLEDDPLRDLLHEVYGALDADHDVLAAIGARTALDRAMVLSGATESFGFGRKLDELRHQGFISSHEQEILETLTDAGSAAAHRGWKPDQKMLATIMDGTESFLHKAFILGKAVDAIKNNVPPKQSLPKRLQKKT
jgi:hypothetical protein